MRAVFRAAALLVSLGVLLPAAARAQANLDWHRGIPGFRIAGNLYYVGTADLAAYLIATPQGNILINGNFKEDVPALRKRYAIRTPTYTPFAQGRSERLHLLSLAELLPIL